MDRSRFYINPFVASKDDLQFFSSLQNHLDENISVIASDIVNHYDDRHDGSLYTGSLGKVYILYRLNRLHEASRHVLPHINQSDNRFTLLEGRKVGALAMSCAIHFKLKNTEILREHSDMLLNLSHHVHSYLSEQECDVMYGKAGFLHAILFVRKEIGDDNYGSEQVLHILMDILQEGIKNKTEHFPLLWKWHQKIYLGSAHGVAGILQTLMSYKDEVCILEQRTNRDFIGDINKTIMSLLSVRFLSGNLPSSMGKERDNLVQWCHGAPGLILLLVKAYEVFDKIDYLHQAVDIALKVVWPRGLLRKGMGLCHGISGNAYSFLALYRVLNTLKHRGGDIKDEEIDIWLYRSWRFVEFAYQHQQELHRVPDHPYSLFEGLGGFCCLLIDLKAPILSHFPLFHF
jgi:lantibiotic modifying enzyme